MAIGDATDPTSTIPTITGTNSRTGNPIYGSPPPNTNPLNLPTGDPTAVGSQIAGQFPGLIQGVSQLFGGTKTPGQQATGASPLSVLANALNPQAQYIPGLTGIEQQAGGIIGNQLNQPAGYVPPAQNQALQQISNLTSGAVSPATQAALTQFQNLTQPLIQQQAALSGTGNSGTLLQDLNTGLSSTLTPLLQTQLANQEAAIPQLTAIGGNQATAEQQALNNALGYGALSRGVTTQQSGSQLAAQTAANQLATTLGLGGALSPLSQAISGEFSPNQQTSGKK